MTIQTQERPPEKARPAGIDADACYRRYGPMVLRRCRHLLRDEERARDAMHDVFINVLRHRDRLDDSAPSSLLYRIATNVCLNHLRTARRHPETSGDHLGEQIAEGADPERVATSRSVLARLFDTDLEPIALMAWLRYGGGMTLAEVAREVGLSASCVRKRLSVLRDRLPGLEA